jgi:hypothetical protein
LSKNYKAPAPEIHPSLLKEVYLKCLFGLFGLFVPTDNMTDSLV